MYDVVIRRYVFFFFFFPSLDRMAPATMTRNEICEHSHVIDASET